VKKKPSASSKRRVVPVVPHPDDMADACEAAASAERDDFLSASTSASIVASWLEHDKRPKKKT
jgi:hypothetical protein